MAKVKPSLPAVKSLGVGSRLSSMHLLHAVLPFLVASVLIGGESPPQAPLQHERSVPVPTAGFRAVRPGEHPRLYMRPNDQAQLRAQAATPRGREVVQGLLNLVGGGTKVGPPDTENKGERYRASGFAQAGTFGVLYQITGEARFADLARKAIERYYTEPETARLTTFLTDRDTWSYGNSCALPMAELMAYDLCYDAWEPGFRRTVAVRLARWAAVLVTRVQAEAPPDPAMDVAGLIDTAGTVVPGRDRDYTGMGFTRRLLVSQSLLLGIRGDPDLPAGPWDAWLAAARGRFDEFLPGAFGEHGRHLRYKLWGWMIAAGSGLDEALISWRNAGGFDYTGDIRVRGLSLQWVPELMQRDSGGCWVRRHEGGSLVQPYGAQPHTETWNHFPDAFAMLRGAEQGALLWSWNHTIRPHLAGRPAEKRWDLDDHSYRAINVLLYWPADSAEVNPASVLPRPYADLATGSVVFRNRWQDDQDVMIDCWIGGTDDFRNAVVLWARGKRTTLGFLGITAPEQGVWQTNDQGEIDAATYYRKAGEAEKGGKPRLVAPPAPSPDGSGAASYSNGNAIAVDFTPGAGLDALIAMTGPGVDGLPGSGGAPGPGPRNTRWNEDFAGGTADRILTVGERRIRITTVGAGPHPVPVVSDGAVTVGRKVVRLGATGLVISPASP